MSYSIKPLPFNNNPTLQEMANSITVKYSFKSRIFYEKKKTKYFVKKDKYKINGLQHSLGRNKRHKKHFEQEKLFPYKKESPSQAIDFEITSNQKQSLWKEQHTSKELDTCLYQIWLRHRPKKLVSTFVHMYEPIPCLDVELWKEK